MSLRFALLLMICSISCCGGICAAQKNKTTLVFSLDQGFGNGVVVQTDLVAVKRMISALTPLSQRYNVYVLLNPQVADHKGMDSILDLLMTEKMPFLFDVYSSDSMTLGSSTVQNKPFDPRHGISISIDELTAYKKRCGKWLAGLRIMEVFSQDFTVRAAKTTNPEWAQPGWKMPDDAFFQPKFAEQFLAFAKKNSMFVQWSDWHWYEFAGWDAPQKDCELEMSGLLRKYSGLVTVTYANNEPNEDSVKRLDYWEKSVQKFVIDGAVGYGLSDQAWLRKDHLTCPADDIISWAKDALGKGCRYIQFEPAWYFFKLPCGSFGVQNYTTDSKWVDRGEPTESFKKLAGALIK